MQVKILKPISHASTPRPFLPGELLTVPADQAQRWVAEGKAAPWPPADKPGAALAPQRHARRERAVRVG